MKQSAKLYSSHLDIIQSFQVGISDTIKCFTFQH